MHGPLTMKMKCRERQKDKKKIEGERQNIVYLSPAIITVRSGVKIVMNTHLWGLEVEQDDREKEQRSNTYSSTE